MVTKCPSVRNLLSLSNVTHMLIISQYTGISVALDNNTEGDVLYTDFSNVSENNYSYFMTRKSE